MREMGGVVDVVVIGRILRPHGIKGGIKVNLMTDWPERYRIGEPIYVSTEDRPGSWRVIKDMHLQNKRLILKFEGVDDCDSAEALRNHLLQVRADQRPQMNKDTYYVPDLIGCDVRTVEGKMVGTLKEILQNTPQDIYVIETDIGDDILIPAVKEFVKDINIGQGLITIDPIEGLINSDEN